MLYLSCADFSYKEFMAGKGLSTDSTLSVNNRIDLMETLGLTDFLNTDQCSIVDWINGKDDFFLISLYNGFTFLLT